MKNIHIIPTDKPSRLFKLFSQEDELLLGKSSIELDMRDRNLLVLPQHIYITSDEKPKDGYYLDLTHNIVMKSVFYPSSDKNCKKIILTTDPDLIKDGVQAIDDEFLEWFVKNPTCDTIDIDSIPNSNWGFDLEEPMNLGYKIIIPKEEIIIISGGDDIAFPSSTIITFKPLPDVNWESDITNKVWDEDEPKQIKCYCGHTITCDCEPLQETLEEVAERLFNNFQKENPIIPTEDIRPFKLGFIKGTKWKEERMYSEEDMINFAHFYFKEEFNSTIQTNKSTKELLSEWFERNKKKFG